MSGVVYRVPPMSVSAVRGTAEGLRSALSLDNEPLFPVMTVLEKVLDNRLELIRLEIWPDTDLQGVEGLTFRDDEGVDRIVLPQSVYHSAWSDDGRARFTAAHEIGHWALHSKCALARAHASTLKPFENSEWQANLFAAEILMPVRFIYADDTAQDLCTRFRVSLQAAELRLRNLAKWGIALKRKPPPFGGGSKFVTG